MRDFRKYRVWEHAIELAVMIYELTKFLPDREKYLLVKQMQRAAVSIAANIAEGCSRSSEKEFKHYVEMALGSAFELETEMTITDKIYSIAAEKLYTDSLNLLNTVQSELNALRNTLL